MNFFLETLMVLILSIYYIMESFVKLFLPTRRKCVAGEIVLITGAGSGIGRLMALEFSSMAVTLVLWDINQEGNEETARLAKEKGASEVYTYTCDCSKKTEIYRVADQVKREVGDVGILINNAGIVTGKKFMDASDSLVEKTMEVNAIAHFWHREVAKFGKKHTISISPMVLDHDAAAMKSASDVSVIKTYKAFLPAMMASNHGHLVSIASSAGLIGVNGLADYCASKFAAVGFAESVALELLATGKDGIKTTIVCPFVIDTGMFDGCNSKWPRMIPILNPNYVARKIVDAILTNQVYLLLPRSMYVIAGLKKVGVVMGDYLGAFHLMDDFKGRKKSKLKVEGDLLGCYC